MRTICLVSAIVAGLAFALAPATSLTPWPGSALAVPVEGTAGLCAEPFSDDGFEYQDCQRWCKWKFNVGIYAVDQDEAATHYDRSDYYAYSRCIDDCTRKFWADFEKTKKDN